MPPEKNSADKTTLDAHGRHMHYSVGALIERDGKLLLIDRALPPWGHACIAGHIEDNEEPHEALRREVREETTLEVIRADLILEQVFDQEECRTNIHVHHWRVYRCTVRGTIRKQDTEVKSYGWYTPEQISTMTLEPAWKTFLTTLGYLRK